MVGKKKTDLIDLSVVTSETPFALMMGAADTSCTPETNQQTIETMGDGIGFSKFYEGVGHSDFILVNTPEYINDILTFLAPNSTDTTFLQ